MKNLLFGLLALGSLSSFAQDLTLLTIINKTDPSKIISITCEDKNCEFIKIALPYNREKVIEFAKLQDLADQRVKRDQYVYGCLICSDYRPYWATSNLITNYREETSDLWKRGYEVLAVLRTLLIPFAVVGETVILPFSGIGDLVSYKKDATKKKKKRYSKKVLSKIKDFEVYEVKERKFIKYESFFNNFY
jgi:hypothetical protein